MYHGVILLILHRRKYQYLVIFPMKPVHGLYICVYSLHIEGTIHIYMGSYLLHPALPVELQECIPHGLLYILFRYIPPLHEHPECCHGKADILHLVQ